MTGTDPQQIENTYLVVNKIDELKDSNSSGKISAKCLKDISKSDLENEGLYSQALLPLASKAILEDMSEGSKKQGAMALVENIMGLGSKVLDSKALDRTNKLLKILEFFSHPS